MNQILSQAQQKIDVLIAYRRWLHTHAETGFALKDTTAFVIDKLTEMGYQPVPCGQSGIVATIGNGDHTVLLRADMDALPVREEASLPFACKNGNMHACGHDMHTAMLLAAAQMLKEQEDELEGTVKLMFQPAEETMEGAKMMIEGGIFGVGNGIWIVVAVVVSAIIMCMGIAGGIEKACKVMIPALFGLFLVLAVYIAFLPGAVDGYKYIFTLNPAGLLDWKVWIYAFGQAFFSLSVAGNGSVIYGSYLGKDVEISSSAARVAFFDTLAALVAMFVIIPAMATTGSELSAAGPGLMFVYLPNVFNGMGAMGRFVGIFFFVAVLFAGVSSIINLYETPVAFLQEKFKMARIPAVIVIHVIGLVVALLIQPWTSQWMDMISIYICPLGAALAGVMFFWVMKKETALEAVNMGSDKKIGGWFHPFGKWVYVPLCIIALVAGAALGGIG